MAKWTKELPSEPGRYFYCGTEDYSYGIALVAWDKGYCHAGYVKQPAMNLRCVSIWGRNHPTTSWLNEGSGENTDHPGWSSSCGAPPLKDLEFWSEPIQTPPDFLPINGRPPDIPQEEIDKANDAGKKQSKKRAKEERDREKKRTARIKQAKAEGRGLYKCNDCEEVWDEDELVLGKERECPHCNETFVAEERNCPSCNRPFARVNEERMTCPDCRDSGSLPGLTALVEPKT